ncbi:MAG TPA: response regulator transcription factor, partial [Desertimonas sp.]|nr:response regulator transcription factor [Desertimonas sp.]
ETADAMIRRALDEAHDPISRARLLGPCVEIVLATGDTTTARDAAEELRQVAATLGTPLLRAHAAGAAGAVLTAAGDPKTALVELRRAFNEFNSLGVRYHAARTRLLIADACAALGDHDSAAIESSAARAVLETLTSTATTVHATVAPGTTSSPGGLTQRELEILRLVARGKTNRGIAQELVISEKTVASHVSHIFTKLGVTSRSAATAYAYDHNLVE